MSTRASATRRHLPTSPFQPAPPQPQAEEFVPDDRVTHDRYGMGTVLSIEAGQWATVRFSSGQVLSVATIKLSKL
ncbi:hypothetical protein [Kineococcus sp. SYSU DK005]|uniref:hypothetical protein n=1 Tax=Kineococcus sp. SYSU DK005 TaxID=3383126 RepID=UPI003D7E8AD6